MIAICFPWTLLVSLEFVVYTFVYFKPVLSILFGVLLIAWWNVSGKFLDVDYDPEFDDLEQYRNRRRPMWIHDVYERSGDYIIPVKRSYFGRE